MGKHLTPKQKARIVLLHGKKYTAGQIAQAVRCSRHQVYHFLERGASGYTINGEKPQQQPINVIEIKPFAWEQELDAFGPKVIEALQGALEAGDDKTAQGWLDKIAKVVQVKRGGALIDIRSTVNIQQTFIQLPQAEQITIIQSSPHWSALVAEMADVLAGCGTCSKAQELLKKIREG